MSIPLLLIFGLDSSLGFPSKVLQFQIDSEGGGSYSTEEWAAYKGTIPHMSSFTACHWEKLRFFNVQESCQWAYCYKNTNASTDYKCTQLWYDRDSESGGRYVSVNGGFGDNSFGGKLLTKVVFLLSSAQALSSSWVELVLFSVNPATHLSPPTPTGKVYFIRSSS